MKKKSLMILGLAIGMSLSMSLLSYAGEWKQDTTGWWWQNDDGTYPVNRWQWIDGNNDGIAEYYYFNENGYLLVDTTIPDSYIVNKDGAWIKTYFRGGEVMLTDASSSGGVQTINAEELNKINTGKRVTYRIDTANSILETEILEDGSLRVISHASAGGLSEEVVSKSGDREWKRVVPYYIGGPVMESVSTYVFNEDYSELTITLTSTTTVGSEVTYKDSSISKWIRQ